MVDVCVDGSSLSKNLSWVVKEKRETMLSCVLKCRGRRGALVGLSIVHDCGVFVMQK